MSCSSPYPLLSCLLAFGWKYCSVSRSIFSEEVRLCWLPWVALHWLLFYCLACSPGAALQHRQSYGSAFSWALCPTVLWGRNGIAREVKVLLPNSRMSAVGSTWGLRLCFALLGGFSTVRMWPRYFLLCQRSCTLASPLSLWGMLLDQASVSQLGRTNFIREEKASFSTLLCASPKVRGKC